MAWLLSHANTQCVSQHTTVAPGQCPQDGTWAPCHMHMCLCDQGNHMHMCLFDKGNQMQPQASGVHHRHVVGRLLQGLPPAEPQRVIKVQLQQRAGMIRILLHATMADTSSKSRIIVVMSPALTATALPFDWSHRCLPARHPAQQASRPLVPPRHPCSDLGH